MKAVLTLFTLLFLASFSVAQIHDKQIELEKSIQNRQVELERIENELTEKKEYVENLKSREKEHLNKLYALDEKMNLNSQLITSITKQVGDINLLIDDMQDELKFNQQDLAYRYGVLNDRLVWIYKRSRVSSLATALSADGPVQAARRLYLFSLLNNYDREMVNQIDSLITTIEYEKEAMQNRQSEIKSLIRAKRKQSKLIRADRKNRDILLNRVRSEKDTELKAIRQLDKDQERINSIVETLLEDKKILNTSAAAEFENLKGKLLWPVFGKVLRKFGKIKDKKYNTTINNPGIDIKAEAGADVIASSSGEVAYVSWLRGYGSFVILDHGGGYYTLYAHLDNIFVENHQFITAGESIATVSETGAFSGPIIHFELRYGKEQYDPLPWLR